MVERETVITLNDDEGIARIYTSEPRMLAKLRRLPAAVLISEGNADGAEWADFTVPAEVIFRHRRAPSVNQRLTLPDASPGSCRLP